MSFSNFAIVLYLKLVLQRQVEGKLTKPPCPITTIGQNLFDNGGKAFAQSPGNMKATNQYDYTTNFKGEGVKWESRSSDAVQIFNMKSTRFQFRFCRVSALKNNTFALHQ